MGKYVVLYDPKEVYAQKHTCDLPDLTSYENKIWWQTIVECEDCAQKWVAMIYKDSRSTNKWVPLRWYHFKWKGNLRR